MLDYTCCRLERLVIRNYFLEHAAGEHLADHRRALGNVLLVH